MKTTIPARIKRALRSDWGVIVLIILAGAVVAGHSIWRLEYVESFRYTRYLFRALGGTALAFVGIGLATHRIRKKSATPKAGRR